MITSKDNEKLKLVRRLRARRNREREGLFLTEGEDLLEAGRAAGHEPELLLSAAGAGLGGDEVEPALLAGVAALGSGTRAIAVWRRPPDAVPAGPTCVYLHGVGDPGNVGAIVRSAHALVAGSVALGPGCADPYSPRAVRASMGSVFGIAVGHASIDETPMPRVAMVAAGGSAPAPMRGPMTLCLGNERSGLPAEAIAACEESWTVPMRPGGAPSLNVAAAAAIALERISSAAAEGGAR